MPKASHSIEYVLQKICSVEMPVVRTSVSSCGEKTRTRNLLRREREGNECFIHSSTERFRSKHLTVITRIRIISRKIEHIYRVVILCVYVLIKQTCI